MDKRLNRTEMMFSLGFLFMLIFAVTAFFYGVKIGSEKTEAIYQPMKLLNADVGAQLTAYQQQDLVSFYHTVFLPYREFQIAWFETTDKLRSNRLTEAASSFKEMSKFAKKQYQIVLEASMPAISPLLQQSQVNTLKSLKLFEQAAERLASSSGNLEMSQIISELSNDAYYTQAVEHALLAQQDYYASMLKWSASVDHDMPEEFDSPALLDLTTWSAQPLLVKNKIMADQLASRQTLSLYYPHDLSTRVDEFIESGQATKMKVKTVTSIVDLLLSTKAVRSGDFASNKSSFYEQELLPQLPFFSSPND